MRPRTATRCRLRGDGAGGVNVGLERTFAYHFVYFNDVRNCHAPFLDDTSTRRSGNRRDGRLAGRHSERVFRPVWSGNGIRAGGAAFIWRPWHLIHGRRAKGTAKYHGARLCLSKRSGAAGSDWALAPGPVSIALERKLEQLRIAPFNWPSLFLGRALRASRNLHSARTSRLYRRVGATPGQNGTQWVGTAASSAVGHDGRLPRETFTVVHTASGEAA